MQGLLAMTMVVRDEEDILDANLADHPRSVSTSSS
jgi:hypothetical protein